MQRFRTLARSATDAIAIIDANNTVRYANPALERVLGYAPEALEGESLTRLMPERFRDRHRAAFERYLETGQRRLDWEAVRFPGLHADGHEVPLEVSFAEFEVGGERLFAGIIRDVTAREERERELREQKEQFQRLVQAVEEYAIFMLDREGHVVTWNAGAERIKGYTEAEIRGEHVSTFYPADAVEAGRPERLLAQAVEEGSVEDENWRIRKDGSRFWASVTITAIHDADGDLQGFTKVTRDMTERKERERELTRYENAVETIDDLVYALDADGCFTLVNEAAEVLADVSSDELLGEHASTVFAGETVAAMEERIVDLLADEGRTTLTEELPLRAVDGTEAWYEVNITLLQADDGTFQGTVGVARDVTERKRREDRLAGLNELVTELLEADSRRQVADAVVDRAASMLNLPVALVASYDDTSGALEPVAATPAAESVLDVDGLLGAGTPAWQTFTEGEPRSLSAAAGSLAADAGPIGIWPLGRHGVLVASMDEGTAVADAFGATVAASVHTALDRAERVQLLEEREARLADLADQLERVNRINDVIRRIDRALVAASTRSAIEEAVCEELARFDPYRFVVVADYDRLDATVVARESAGDERGYLDAASLDDGPTAVAADTREPRVVQELLTDPPLESWREAALARDFGACLALPLVYGDSLYGVLTVFGDRPNLFDETERDVLAELADNIAQSVNAVESKKALVSDRVVELEFTTRDEDVPFVALATDTGGTFEFDSVVPQADGRFRGFFLVRGAAPDDVRAFLDQSVAVEDCRLVADRDDGLLFSCLLTDAAVVSHLVDHGVLPRELTAEPGRGRLVVELSPDADVREFVETLEARYRDVELVARRERERSRWTREGFRTAVEDTLTDRQLEVLRTAYHSGYFESPRASSGETVAESLGISQPTFAGHLRTAHRKLLTMLLEERPDDIDDWDD